MNYYQFHIGDFNNATRHLDRIERSVYRDLLDLYYDKESPLITDIDKLSKLILASDIKETVQNVLNEFFELRDDGYHKSRCDEEIRIYKMKRKTASKAGKASGKIRRDKASERVLNSVGVPLNQPLTINHKPVTNNHNNKKKVNGFCKPTIKEIKDYLQEKNITSFSAEHFFNHYEANGWMRGKNKIKSWKACVNTWKSNNSQNQTTQQKNYEAFPI